MPSKEADFRTKNSKNIKRKAPVYIMHGFPNTGGGLGSGSFWVRISGKNMIKLEKNGGWPLF